MIRILQVVTPVHVGEGAAVGAVDLPVARERHTGWPLVPGTSLKGSLRERAARMGFTRPEITRLFGSEPEEDPVRGAISFGDAVLLALAVRSLQGTFALVTSPLALARLARWLPGSPPVPEPGIERVVCADPARLREPELDRVVLEDLPMLLGKDDLRPWADHLCGLVGEEAPLEHLALVHDDVLGLAARAWLPVRTRAAIDEDGVVKQGALFTTESLPPETLLFATLQGTPPERAGLLPGPGEVFALGGQRTVGCGRVAWYGGV
jgi:CRISPR-associated protein Cmr4